MEGKRKRQDKEEHTGKVLKTGFAGILSHILKKNIPEGHDPVLAKRKTKNELLQEQSVSNKREIVEKITHARFRRMQNMVIPERITELDQQLKRIATRGVVTLFNTIAKQQKELQEDDPSTEKAVKAMSKEGFLNLLKSQSDKPQKSQPSLSLENEASTKQSEWNVLRDDFAMNAKMKDWDQESEDSEQEEELNFSSEEEVEEEYE